MKKVSGSPLPLGVTYKNGRANFAMEVPEGKTCKLLLYRKGEASLLASYVFSDRIGSVCYMAVDGLKEEAYEYNYDIDGERVTDSYAKALSGKEVWFKNIEISEKSKENVRGIFYEDHYDWEADQSPRIQEEELIAYAIHVRGFTKDTHSKVKNKGTFQGVIEKIPYLKDLGINQIQCMPVYEFEEAGMRINYWGYGPGYYFAPKSAYAKDGDGVKGLKDLVKYCHKAGIEVVLEMPFAEGISGLMVTDCLRNYVMEYHVDGFHVRGVQGICNLMATDPLFADTKLLNIYFPVEEIYGKKNLPKKRMVAECNDGFMIDVRRFLKGDEESLKAFAERMRRNPKGSGLINYIASHDGFTLCDLVSYEERHNEDNGEQNRDGRVQNYSWNCGEEGKSRKKKILELRNRQMKNAWCMLLLSAGTPMILAGDEFCNSQLGNNNPYCLDNEISWLDWKGYKSGNSEMFRFVKDLIAFRKKHKILHMGQELSMTDSLSCGFPGISYHSSSAWYGELDGQNRKIGVMYCGKYADEDELIYIAYNMHWMEHTFALPALPGGYRWNVALDTSEGILEEDKWRLLPDSRQVQVSSRTVIVLIGRKHKDVKESNRTLHNHHKA